jgi:hypothetical protein
MTTLNWRKAIEVRLTDKIIPNPTSTSELLDLLGQVSIAVEAGFLHIDPRKDADRGGYGIPEDIYIVPAASVLYVKYVEPKEEEVSAVDSIF